MTDQPTIGDRIADTIRDQCPANPATLAGCHQCTAQHAAVMAVIGPVLDAKDAEIERITQIANVMSGLHRSAEQDAIDQRQRAEAAEERLNDIREEGRDL